MSQAVIVGRPITGISINGLEWLVDEDGFVEIFTSIDSAREYLKSKGVSDEEIEYLTFKESIGTCKHCGYPLFQSDVEGYTSQCFNCDEDFFGIEQETV